MPDYRQRFGALVSADRLSIRAEAPTARGDDKVAVLRLYDPIDSYGGYWGVSAKEMAEVLDELPDSIETIELHINSPGGEVFEAIAILNTLRAHKARVVAVVEGVAASSASFIACGLDEVVMARNSELFIHNAWGLCVGNAGEMRKLADDLEHFDRNIASIYATKAGGTIDDWLAVADAETWYSAEQAVDAGLADSVDTGTEPDDADKAKARFDLTIFNLAGRAAPEPKPSATLPSPRPDTGQKGGSMPELTPEHLALLGLAEDASAEDINAKLTALAAPPPPPAPLPEGVVAVDSAQLEQLRADATAGREARAQQLADERERTVLAAVHDGRIPPARKDHWVAQLEADPGAGEVLAGLAKGTIPVGSPIGTNGPADLDTDEAFYASLFGEGVKA